MHHASVRSSGGSEVGAQVVRERGDRRAICSTRPPGLQSIWSVHVRPSRHIVPQTVVCSEMSLHTSHIMPGFSPLACQLEDLVEETSREFVGAPPIPADVESLESEERKCHRTFAKEPHIKRIQVRNNLTRFGLQLSYGATGGCILPDL